MGSLKMASRAILPTFISLLFVQVVSGIVPFIRSDSDVDNENYDFSRSTPEEAYENKLLYKILNHILIENLYKLEHQASPSDYEPQSQEYSGEQFMSSVKRVSPEMEEKQKRKVFWQPMGYLPAGSNPSTKGSHSSASGSSSRQVFRYGRK